MTWRQTAESREAAMTPRQQELIAREMLEHPELLGIRLTERRWGDVAALVRYLKDDVPEDLAMTDPALYKTLRDQVTLLRLRGVGGLSLAKLEALAAFETPGRSISAPAARTPETSPGTT